MAFQYGSYAIPQAQESPLAALLPAFEAGQQKRKDEDAAQAFARLSQQGPYQQQSSLADLAAPPPPQPTIAADGHPATVGDRSADLQSYESGVAARESNGNPNAVNPTTGATGLYQALPSTWADVSARHPELGLTPQGITDPGQQQKFMQAFTTDNARQLQAAGIAPNPANLYAAHFLGAGGAQKVLSAPDDTLVASLEPAAARANPNIANMNVGQFKAWAGQGGTNPNGGYAPPAAPQPQQQPAGGPPSASVGAPASPAAAGGLPDRATMLALFRSPDTRPLAVAMVQAVQAGQSPKGLLDQALERAQVAKLNQDVNGGAIPDGYRRSATGGLEAIPGGPDDPANPLNAMKTGSYGATMSGNTQVATNSAGVPDPQQQSAFLQSLPTGTAGLVKGIADYQLDATKVTSLRGNQRQQMIQLVQQYDPTFDMSQYPARAAMRKSITSGNYAQALNSANTLIGHLDSLSAAADALHNGNFTPLNALGNTYKTLTGDPTTTNFKTIADAAGNELAKVFKGTGATDMHSIEEWRANLDAASSPAQIKGAIATAIGDLLKSRIDTLQTQYQSVMGKPGDFHFLTPHARQALTDLGLDPNTLDPADAQQPTSQAGQPPVQIKGDDDYNALPSGATFIGPDGQTRQKP